MDGMPMVLTLADVMPAAAEIFVGLAACVLLLVDALGGGRARNAAFLLAIAALAGAAWVSSAVAVPGRTVILAGHFVADPMGTVLKLFAYGAAAVTLLYSREYLERRELLKGEYLVLALFAVLGIQVIVSAGSLLSLYLGIEVMSLSLYAMVAFDRDDGVAAESAMK
jgi:NADH-quinone oxidoreductase subunit N